MAFTLKNHQKNIDQHWHFQKNYWLDHMTCAGEKLHCHWCTTALCAGVPHCSEEPVCCWQPLGVGEMWQRCIWSEAISEVEWQLLFCLTVLLREEFENVAEAEPLHMLAMCPFLSQLLQKRLRAKDLLRKCFPFAPHLMQTYDAGTGLERKLFKVSPHDDSDTFEHSIHELLLNDRVE